MRKAIATGAAAILIGAAIAPLTPAAAQADPAPAQGPAGSQSQAADHDQVVLRRDGDRAVPFRAVIGGGESPADEGFHWGDALIGAGGAYALILLGSGAFLLIRRGRPTRRLTQRPA
jgi:hypothetical protein